MTHTVYAIRDAEHWTLYVGVTNDFDRRYREHCRRPEFAGTNMVGLGGFRDRLLAERVEARTIAVLRPDINRSRPLRPSGYARQQSAVIELFDALFGDVLHHMEPS